jgi:GTPase SAR1 family protein
MKNKINRFYVFTGKGGVGKTTLALSFTKHLTDLGYNATYTYLEQNVPESVYDDLNINYQQLKPFESAEIYLGKQFKSKIIASFVSKAPFFRNVVNVMPSFNYVLYIGHLLHQLHESEDQESIIVLDSPSSGHAMMMFESIFNFKEMFDAGIIFNDLNKMIDFLYSEDFLKIFVCAATTTLSLTEAKELKDFLKDLKVKNVETILNNVITAIPNIKENSLPKVINEKLKQEKKLVNNHSKDYEFIIPYSLELENLNKLNDLKENMSILV